MASNKDPEFNKESTTETSFDLGAIPGPSTKYENTAFIESCPAILEPSKAKVEDEDFRNSMDIFTYYPPPKPTFVPALVGSASIPPFNPGPLEQRNVEHGKRNCCRIVYNCYRKAAIAFRNSRYFYIIQLALFLLPLITIAMGIKYSRHCNNTFPVLTLIIGIIGVLFVGMWISINIYHHYGRKCTGQQKFLVRLLLGFLAILLTIEMALYFSTEPSDNPTDKGYCNKIFIDFTLNKYIAIGGSLILAIIIYIPDYRSFICSFECSMPITNVPYDQI